jgi:hypothetical protein
MQLIVSHLVNMMIDKLHQRVFIYLIKNQQVVIVSFNILLDIEMSS